MRRSKHRSLALLPALVVALFILLGSAEAEADFGFLPGEAGFAVSMPKDGHSAREAGTHPDALNIHLGLASSGSATDGDLRRLELGLPQGMLLNPEAVRVSAGAPEECTQALFFTSRSSPYETSLSGESCPDSSQVGVAAVHLGPDGSTTRYFGLFNLAAPYGSAEAIGFSPFGVPVVLTGDLSGAGTLSLSLANLSQAFDLHSLDLTLWGTPWDYHHDVERGNCLNEQDPISYHGAPSQLDGASFQPGTCYVPSSAATRATPNTPSYVTLPTTCGQQMAFTARAVSWRGAASAATAVIREGGAPVSVSNCLEVLTRAKAQLRTDKAATATGLIFGLDVNDGGGFTNPEGHVRSPIERSRATLPDGLSINPSLGAGLGVCTEEDFSRESADSPPGSGCPFTSKIGTVSVTGLLGLSEEIDGSVFLAKPYANPSHSLIALYITLASPRRGFFYSSYGTLEPDPASGRISTSFNGLPPIHYDHFSLSLRQGERAPLISPPTCGAHAVTLESNPYNDPGIILTDLGFFGIESGEGGGPCPDGGRPPFHPGLDAGSDNANAGSYTPFRLRMTRTDAEQEITSYSATFPPGLLGKLAGIPYCPEAAIAAAAGRSGTEELAAPSCPAASRIGHTLAGYGVGSTLAYAPGDLYLSGPYHGAPFSITAVDPALVGPFDLGVVIVRSAIRVDPRSAQVSIDSAGSDPIPHILKGIPLHLRDVRVEVDRPDFTVNPTSCDPLATVSTLSGAGLDLASAADNSIAGTSSRYQLSNCSAYGLRPTLTLTLRGGHKRGAYPSLHALYRTRPEDANLKQIQVALPNSIFLAQEHLGEVCSLVRFRAGNCPASSRLGFAVAKTPLLDEPMKGPVYLRSNPEQTLPNLVADLSGRGIEIEVPARIDRGPRGGMRATFSSLPDAPVTSFAMNLFGGKRSVLVASDDLCRVHKPAVAKMIAQNNTTAVLHPRLRVKCGGAKKHGRGGR